MRNIIKGLGFAATQIKDATLFWMIVEKEIDFDHILNGDKVTALFPCSIAAILTKELNHAVVFKLMVLVKCNRCHSAFVRLTWAVNIKVTEANHLSCICFLSKALAHHLIK